MWFLYNLIVGNNSSTYFTIVTCFHYIFDTMWEKRDEALPRPYKTHKCQHQYQQTDIIVY